MGRRDEDEGEEWLMACAPQKRKERETKGSGSGTDFCREERWEWGDREERLEGAGGHSEWPSSSPSSQWLNRWPGGEGSRWNMGVFQIWLSNWPRVPRTLRKASRPSYANVWPESPPPPERSPPQWVSVGSPGNSLISIWNWTISVYTS